VREEKLSLDKAICACSLSAAERALRNLRPLQ
jgi:hypothetical protein